MPLLRSTLEDQKSNFGAQLAGQSLQIQELKLEKQSKYEYFEQFAKAAKTKKGELEDEIKELRISLALEAKTINGHQSRIAELEKTVEAKAAFLKGHPELASSENTRGQAWQVQLIDASTATHTRTKQLERLLKAKDAAHKDLMSKELDNTRHQLAKTTRLESAIAWTDAEQAILREQHIADLKSQQSFWQGLLQEKDAKFQRINAQHLEERESQRLKMQALQDDLDVQNNAMDVDIVSDHVCDHSKCIIEKLQQSVKTSNRDSEISELRRTDSGLTTTLEDRKQRMNTMSADSQMACRNANHIIKETEDRLEKKEKELKEEKLRR